MKLYTRDDYLLNSSTLAEPQIKLDQIKGASLNLKVGKIFVPGKKSEELGSVEKPLTVFSLKQGATVVLKTSQRVKLNSQQTGIMFPPNHVSLKGLLMTNPGHVDPGFEGHLHVTVINMGSAPYELRAEDQVIRLMVFELDDTPPAYGPSLDPVSEQLLQNLSHDFFDISSRISSEIALQERKSKTLAIAIPVIASITTLIAAMYFSSNQLGERIAKLEGTTSPSAISSQLNQNKNELQVLNIKLENLEKRIGSTIQGEKP